jgi:5-methylcytosine-specific restriction endonuclease McrA
MPLDTLLQKIEAGELPRPRLGWRVESVPSIARTHTERAKKFGCKHWLLTPEALIIFFSRYEYKCARCGTTEQGVMTIDHITPLSKGGSNRIRNFQPMCRTCNQFKADKAGGDYRNRLTA